MTPTRWEWDATVGPRVLRSELDSKGVAWLHAPELVNAVDGDPWGVAERLLGEPPALLERQPIHAIPNGRSFASGSMPAPFHSDSQMFLGVPPDVQVMACRTAAESGGENLYLDTWALLERIERDDPPLLEELFTAERHFPFVFGDVTGPTVSSRGGRLVFTHTPRPPTGDGVARRLQAFIDVSPVIEIRAEQGDLVAIHNHRLLHGRRGFLDTKRRFTRLLAWTREAFPAPVRWLAKALAVDALAPVEPVLDDGERQRRQSVVKELLSGVPAGVLSAREKVPEPELYRWRDQVWRNGGAERI